jgi:hypothetical protein
LLGIAAAAPALGAPALTPPEAGALGFGAAAAGHGAPPGGAGVGSWFIINIVPLNFGAALFNAKLHFVQA